MQSTNYSTGSQPLADAELTKGEKGAIKNLKKETNRIDNTISKDRKAIAKAERKLAKDMEKNKDGRRINTDQALLHKAAEELNYDLAKKQQIENKIESLSAGEENLLDSRNQGSSSSSSYNDPLFSTDSPGYSTTSYPASSTSSAPTLPKVTTTTTIITGPASSSVSPGQDTSYSQGSSGYDQGMPEYVHPTGNAQSRPVQSYGVGQGQSQGGLNSGVGPIQSYGVGQGQSQGGLNSGVGQGQSQGGMNPGDAVVETHTQTHKREILRGKDNASTLGDVRATS